MLADAPDLIVCAAGATPEAPDFAVSGGARVANVWELLGGEVAEIPARAVVVDDGTGFWHGISAVEYLAERGAAVELLTPARGVGLTIPHESIGNVSAPPRKSWRARPRAGKGHRRQRSHGFVRRGIRR